MLDVVRFGDTQQILTNHWDDHIFSRHGSRYLDPASAGLQEHLARHGGDESAPGVLTRSGLTQAVPLPARLPWLGPLCSAALRRRVRGLPPA